MEFEKALKTLYFLRVMNLSAFIGTLFWTVFVTSTLSAEQEVWYNASGEQVKVVEVATSTSSIKGVKKISNYTPSALYQRPTFYNPYGGRGAGKKVKSSRRGSSYSPYRYFSSSRYYRAHDTPYRFNYRPSYGLQGRYQGNGWSVRLNF